MTSITADSLLLDSGANIQPNGSVAVVSDANVIAAAAYRAGSGMFTADSRRLNSGDDSA
ncbi:MAG: hypothetical protein R3C19_09895 [Planctomycetaceae bacterium]